MPTKMEVSQRLQLLLSAVLSVACAQSVIRMSQGLQPSSLAELHSAVKTPHGEKNAFSFASYYGDHMVLQRAPQRATIWGYHPDPGERIIVQVKQQRVYAATVSETGIWKVLLDEESRAGPFTIQAHTETSTITLNDVMFGDVWLCSGQSNMQFTVDMMFNGSEEMKQASKYHQIRVFTAAEQFSKQPLVDLDSVLEHWSLPSNDSLGVRGRYFSAICWLFGRQLYDRFGVPIGLIDTTWGGTPVEAWMSKDALAKCGLSPEMQKSETAVENLMEHSAVVGYDKFSRLPFPTFRNEYSNGELWNAMINPFLPMTIYGVIWDQGEADTGPDDKRRNYNCTFPAMIDDWRAKFSAASSQTSAAFPFGFVQLGTTIPDPIMSVGYPDVRWHQTADYGYVPNPRMKNVFMAVTLDLPDFESPYGAVHTRDKQDIAYRLFLGGLDVAYGVPTLCQGPLPVHATQLADSIILNYGFMWTLDVRQKEGFELCCSRDGSNQCVNNSKSWWVPTPITASNATHISLYAGVCKAGQNILGLRYVWRLSPCAFKECAVYSMENALPAPPFVVYAKPEGSGEKFTFEIDWSVPTTL